MPVPRRWVVASTMVVLLAGCDRGPARFDPAKARPCAFFSDAELDKYALRVARDQTDRCEFDKKPGYEDSLTGVSVEYRDGTAASVAAATGVPPLPAKAAEDTRIEYQGSETPDPSGDPRRGTCWAVAPIGDNRAVVVGIGTDTGNITWVSQQPITDPCKFLADPTVGRPDILAKLRR